MLSLQEDLQLSKNPFFGTSLQVHQREVSVQMQKRAYSFYVEEPPFCLSGGDNGMPILQGKEHKDQPVPVAYGNEALRRVFKTSHRVPQARRSQGGKSRREG